MKRNKLLAIVFAVIFALAVFAGCSDSTQSSSTESTDSAQEGTTEVSQETTEESSSDESESDSIIVKVQSVDGSTVTAIIGEISESEMGEPPEMPEGEAPSDEGETAESDTSEDENTQGSEPPEMPEGEAGTSGGGSEFVEGDETVTFEITDSTTITVEFLDGTGEGTIDSIAAEEILEVTLDGSDATDIIVRNLEASSSSFGGSGEVTNGTSTNTIDEDSEISGETYTSSGDDENALRVDGATVTLDEITVEKAGGDSSNTEDGDFYGQNAGLLVLNGATATITNATITTNAVNGNAVFSYGEGTTVTISDSVIRTTENNSGGIQTTGGGTMIATNLDVETQGNSAAAIRTDRGGGTVNVTGGTFTTNGTGSPAIYSTADITVTGAALTATNSEAVVVEGQNSVSLINCTLTGNMSGTYSDDSENIQNIMIYQSMSGDADIGEASFSAQGGSIVSQNGDMIYVTNTSCTITLEDVELTLSNDTLLKVVGNSSSRGWGTEGANGGDAVFNAINQILTGNIIVDEISSLDMSMTDGTEFTGAINPENEGGEVNVTMDSSSTWTLTSDSYVTSFDGDISNVVSNGYTLYVNGSAAN